MVDFMRLEGLNEAIRVIEDFARKLVPNEMKMFGDALALELGDLVIHGTPVRGANTRPSRRKKGKRGALQEGGRARGGWQGQVGSDGGSGDPGAGVRDKSGSRTLSAGAGSLATRRFHEPFVWFNNVPYILVLEEGRVEGPPARGSLQAPRGMVAVAVEYLTFKKAIEIIGPEVVRST